MGGAAVCMSLKLMLLVEVSRHLSTSDEPAPDEYDLQNPASHDLLSRLQRPISVIGNDTVAGQKKKVSIL
jgi:hypothetical protein